MATTCLTKLILHLSKQESSILSKRPKVARGFSGMSSEKRSESSNPSEKKNKQLKKTQFKLSQPLMKGFIAIPLINGVDFEVDKCKFEWFRQLSSKQKKELEEKDPSALSNIHFGERSYWQKVGDNFTYLLCDDDVAHVLKCMCEPPNSDSNVSVKYWICSEGPVEVGPKNFPFEKRHKLTDERFSPSDDRIRVISYNILADLYADSDYSKTVLFAHCPPFALASGYRRQLLLKEIEGYNADIICLQEVDKKEFNRTYEPYFRIITNHQGTFHTKGSRVAEGVATFFRRDRFELIDSHRTVLNKLINPRVEISKDEVLEVDRDASKKLLEEIKIEKFEGKPLKKEEYPHPILSNMETNEAKNLLSRFDSLRSSISSNANLHKRFIERHTILQTTLLKFLNRENTFLIVANTHLYFAPDADHIRLLQGCVCVRYMEYIKEYYAKLIRAKNLAGDGDENLRLSIIFCGDMNSSPDCGLFTLLQEGTVCEDLKDWSSNENEKVIDVSFNTDLRFSTAYKDIAYTNYTPEFHGCLDYIYYELNGFKLERTIPLPDHEEVIATGGIPSDLFPSDHIALVADFKCE